MFTASHNPAAYNGIKLCRAGAKPVGQDTGLATIRDEIVAGVPAYNGPAGAITEQNVLRDYSDFLRSLVDVTSLGPPRVPSTPATGWQATPLPRCSMRSLR